MGGPYKDYSIRRSILGSQYFGKYQLASGWPGYPRAELVLRPCLPLRHCLPMHMIHTDPKKSEARRSRL